MIFSAAVGPDNIERQEAALRIIPQKSYAEVIGELTRKYFTIAVSGSHGKSTTTALIALMLMRAGLDPTIIVGTKLREFRKGNFRRGRSKYLVLEADEWNRSFHHYAPDVAVFTNIDKEHLDTYKTYAGVVAGFAKYLRNLKSGGVIIANWKDRGVRRAIRTSNFEHRTAKVAWYNRRKFQRHPLQIPGTHNQVNAEAAWQAWRVIASMTRPRNRRGTGRGIDAEKIADAVFRNYRGAWRRLELLHSRFTFHDSRFTIYSDYAHHPTEIKATLQALRERHPKIEIVAVFQPHQQDRLTRLFPEFKHAFSDADTVIIMPIYVVKGREYSKGKTSEDLARAVRDAQYAPTLRSTLKLIRVSRSTPHVSRIIVFMSAGDLDEKIRKLLSN